MKHAVGTKYEFESEIAHPLGIPVGIIRFKEKMSVLSSTILNGGLTETSSFMFMQVPKDYNSSNPYDDITKIRNELNLPENTVGFMTAAEVDYVFKVRNSEYKNMKSFAAVTAGLSNHVVAGEILTNWEERHALSLKRSAKMMYGGTINIMSLSPIPLTTAGKVNAIICVTEAKTAAMNILGYKETGTTSDAIAIVSPIGDGYPYAGTGSDVGIAMARAARDGVLEALITRDDYPEGTDNDRKREIRASIGL